MIILKPKTKKYRREILNRCIKFTNGEIERYEKTENHTGYVKNLRDDLVLLIRNIQNEDGLSERDWYSTLRLGSIYNGVSYRDIKSNWNRIPHISNRSMRST